MNVERMNELADFLDKLDAENFNMGHWRVRNTECGTIACVAGWTVEHFEGPGLCTDFVMDRAREILGLEYHKAIKLFIPNVISYENAHPKDAAAVLRMVADGKHENPQAAWEEQMESKGGEN